MTRTLPTAPTAPTTSLAALAGCRSSRFGPRFDDPKGDDGVIDFSKLDDDQKKAIGTIVETQLNAALKPVIASVATLNEGLSTITERIETFAGDNEMPSCAPPRGSVL